MGARGIGVVGEADGGGQTHDQPSAADRPAKSAPAKEEQQALEDMLPEGWGAPQSGGSGTRGSGSRGRSSSKSKSAPEVALRPVLAAGATLRSAIGKQESQRVVSVVAQRAGGRASPARGLNPPSPPLPLPYRGPALIHTVRGAEQTQRNTGAKSRRKGTAPPQPPPTHLDDLGGDILRRPAHRGQHPRPPKPLGEPKVRELDGGEVLALHQQQVLQLQVAVDDAPAGETGGGKTDRRGRIGCP